MQWFVDLQVKHHVVPDAVEEKAEDSESRFLNGRLGMFLNSRRGVPTYREITGFDWDVAPLPQRQAARRHPARRRLLHADGGREQGRGLDVHRVRQLGRGPDDHRRARAARCRRCKAVAESPAFLDPAAKPANSQVFLDDVPLIRACR